MKTVYIGITKNFEGRLHQRQRTKQLKETVGSKYIQMTPYLPANHIAQLEINTIQEFRNHGWNVLNLSLGGELGTITI